MKPILIINGPNLNMLGRREPGIYGSETLADIKVLCQTKAASLGLEIDFYQSNSEGELITRIQQAAETSSGIIINPAGLGHSSIALMDALLAVSLPAMEVHLSNIYKREEFRHNTYTSRAVKGVISGFGSFGYVMALEVMKRELS